MESRSNLKAWSIWCDAWYLLLRLPLQLLHSPTGDGSTASFSMGYAWVWVSMRAEWLRNSSALCWPLWRNHQASTVNHKSLSPNPFVQLGKSACISTHHKLALECFSMPIIVASQSMQITRRIQTMIRLARSRSSEKILIISLNPLGSIHVILVLCQPTDMNRQPNRCKSATETHIHTWHIHNFARQDWSIAEST